MCNAIARCSLVIFNIIFLICGAGMVFIGIAGIAGGHSMANVFHSTNPEYGLVADVTRVPNLLMSPAVFMIVLGVFIMAFALIGFIGASILWNVLLLVYAILVGILILAEIALIVYCVVLPVQYQQKSEDLLYDSLKEHYTSVNMTDIMDPVTGRIGERGDKAAWLMLEMKMLYAGTCWSFAFLIQFSCCGAHNYTDYKTINWNRTITLFGTTFEAAVPFSCCKNPKQVGANMTKCLKGEVEEINTEGCYKAVIKLVWGFCLHAMVFAIIIIPVEILLLWASFHLFNKG